MKLYLLFAFALGGVLYSAAQETGALIGHITSTMPLLQKVHAKILKTALWGDADSIGNFSISDIPKGNYTVLVTADGFENSRIEVSIQANAITAINVTMNPLSANLNEVVVTGTFSEQSKANSVTSIDVYSAKYFDKNPASNLYDALSSANGIYPDIDQGLSNVTDININGLEGNYTMYLIDGVPAMNGLAGFYALTAFPAGIIDRVEIEEGACSALYGSDAMAGVINIITKNPASAPTFSINANVDSKLDANLDFSATLRLKKVSALFAAAGEAADYRWDINHDNFMDVPLVNRGNFFNKWNFDRKDNKTAFIYARYLFEDRFTGQMNTPGRLLNSDQYYTEWIRTHQWQAGFRYELPLQEKFMLLGDYSEHYQQAYYDTNYFTGTQRTGFLQFDWNKETGKHALLAGAVYRLKYYSDNTGISNEAITGMNNLTHTIGVFVQDEVTFSKQDHLLFGARFDYSTRSGPVAAPRINYKWDSKNEKNTVRAGITTGYRVPNLLDEGFGALNGSRKIEVPEKLKTEYALSALASYTRRQTFSAGSVNFETGIFGTWLFNFVNPDYDTDSTLIIYRNSKGGLSAGVNFKTEIDFKFPFRIGASGTYAFVFEADDDPDGDIDIEIPTHSPPFVGNYFASYTFRKPGIAIDLTGDLVSPMLLATVPNDFRAGHSPWFSILNIKISKKFRNGIEIYAGVKNLLNFIPQNPILRPFDPFNHYVNLNNPNGYRFDTSYGYFPVEGIKGFIGFRYTLQ